MKFKLSIEMDNSAFDYAPFDELTAILETYVTPRNLAVMLEEGVPISLTDSNGNRVGWMRVDKDTEETLNA